MRWIAIGIFFLANFAVLSLRADQVVLKNGDRFSGSIVKKDKKKLRVKSDAYGEVAVPWEDVRSIATDGPVFVQFSNGETLQATIAARDDVLELSTTSGRREAYITNIVALRNEKAQNEYERLLNPTWIELWAGTASFGFAGTQGNAETRTLTVGLNTTRETRADKTSIRFSAIRAAALTDGIEGATAEAVRGGWAYDRNTETRFFINVFNDYEYDRFQNLDLRFVLGRGLGYSFWKDERGTFDVVGGGAYNRESFTSTPDQPGFARHSGEAYFGNEFTYEVNATTSVFQNMRLFPNLSDTGEYRLNADIGANTKLTKWLTWTIALSNRYMSNPVAGRQTNDFLYTTGIGVTFER